MEVKKMRLSIVLRPGRPLSYAAAEYREAWTETTQDGTVINHRKERQSKVYHVGMNAGTSDDVVIPMTPMATAYMYHIMPSLVYTALKTRLSYNGHEMLFNLIGQLISYTEAGEEAIFDYEAYLDKQYTKTVMVCSGTEHEEVIDLKPSTMAVIEHNYKYVTNGNRRYKVELERPDRELRLTEYGKELISNTAKVQCNNVDILDILGDCYAVYVELYNNGLLKKPADVYNYRYAFYRAVNNYINRENRAPIPYMDRMQLFVGGEYDEYGKEVVAFEERIVSGKNIDRSIENIISLDAIANAISLIVNGADTRVNKEAFAKVLTMYVLQGNTYESIAHTLNMHVNQVSRYIGYAKRIASSPNVKSKILD